MQPFVDHNCSVSNLNGNNLPKEISNIATNLYDDSTRKDFEAFLKSLFSNEKVM